MRKLPKILVAFTFIGGIGLLVACGGGGGSTPSTPSAPGNPGAPSGGATTPPSGTTTAPSTTTPTPTPTPKGATPSPTPTVTPTPSATPTPTPTPTPTAHAGTAQINVGYGETNGGTNDLLISTASNTQGYSGGGNLMPGQTGATATGGGQGSPVDGVACQPSMSGNYHVHFFLGVFYNGQEIMVPAGLGMVNPSPPNQSVLNDQVVATGTAGAVPNQSWTANCYYEIHVHDNSGMVHVESTNNGNNCGSAVGGATPPPCSYSIYNFQQFLDEWGVSVSPTNFGPLTGPVQVYTQANPPAPYCMNPCTVNASTLSFYAAGTNGLGAIPIYSHTVIWIVIGTPPSSGLPNVFFEEGNP